MPQDDLLKWRDEFPIVSQTTYLASHTLGAMPRRVYDKVREYADMWGNRGYKSWNEGWFELNGKIGDKIGAIMGAPAGSVAVHQNASIANSILLSAMDFSDTSRNKVVVDDMIFPSDYYTLPAMLPEHIEIEVIKSRDRITIALDDLLVALDERTRLVSLSHVLFGSSYIVPVKQIVTRAHEVGAQVLVNGYHSVGIIPVDVTDMNVDFYIGGVLKWMCGGPGGVFMYVRPDLLMTLHPKITGWLAHKRPFEFELAPVDLREDNYRLLNGTFGIPSLYAIQPGVDIISEIGVDVIRANNVRQTAIIVEKALEAGYTIRTPLDPAQRGGMIVVDMPHAYEVTRELMARNYQLDWRINAGIRISPHFYNTDDEIHAVMNEIADILKSGAWEKHAGDRVFVT